MDDEEILKKVTSQTGGKIKSCSFGEDGELTMVKIVWKGWTQDQEDKIQKVRTLLYDKA